MFRRLFGADKQMAPSRNKDAEKSSSKLENLQKTIDFLEKRQNALEKMSAQQLELAKKYKLAKNIPAALQAIKRKKAYDDQTEVVRNQQMNMEQLMMTIIEQTTNEKIFMTQKLANKQLKESAKLVSVNKVNDIVAQTSEYMDHVAEVRDALQQPLVMDDFDDMQALEELDVELGETEHSTAITDDVQPITELPAVPCATLPSTHPQMTAEEQDLLELERELAMWKQYVYTRLILEFTAKRIKRVIFAQHVPGSTMIYVDYYRDDVT